MPEPIFFTCGREPSYMRNFMLLHSLERHFNVTTLTSSHKHYLPRLASISSRLAVHPMQRYDVAVIGFLGQLLVPLVRTRFKGPLLFDAFLSLYDTLCFDRKRYHPGSVMGRLAFQIDLLSCRQADCILLDTRAHVEYFQHTFNLPAEKFRIWYAGCDEHIFHPLPISSNEITILHYGSHLPLHGIDTILEAAHLLRSESRIRFRLIGAGSQSNTLRKIAVQHELRNIDFVPPIPLTSLPAEIASATICLGGHFGAGEKARRVIAAKTFQCLAMQKPVIVGENPANRELLTHAESAWFVPMQNPQALAEAIIELVQNPSTCHHIAEGGYQVFLKNASLSVLSDQLGKWIEALIIR